MSAELLTTLLNKAKMALRVSTDVFDPEITDIIEAGCRDLETRGIDISQMDPLVIRALMTYVRMMFGEPENPERLRQSYWEQKAALMSTTGFTDWGDMNG